MDLIWFCICWYCFKLKALTFCFKLALKKFIWNIRQNIVLNNASKKLLSHDRTAIQPQSWRVISLQKLIIVFSESIKLRFRLFLRTILRWVLHVANSFSSFYLFISVLLPIVISLDFPHSLINYEYVFHKFSLYYYSFLWWIILLRTTCRHQKQTKTFINWKFNKKRGNLSKSFSIDAIFLINTR